VFVFSLCLTPKVRCAFFQRRFLVDTCHFAFFLKSFLAANCWSFSAVSPTSLQDAGGVIDERVFPPLVFNHLRGPYPFPSIVGRNFLCFFQTWFVHSQVLKDSICLTRRTVVSRRTVSSHFSPGGVPSESSVALHLPTFIATLSDTAYRFSSFMGPFSFLISPWTRYKLSP